ncbi:MAG: GAF domain-containing protein [Pseudomonadota bacterium]
MASLDHDGVLAAARRWLAQPVPPHVALTSLCNHLRGALPHASWVGFYVVDGPGALVLGPFSGPPTDHVRIPFGAGVCGRVAATGTPLVIPDVRVESNYLACSLTVRAEVVVPVLRDGAVVAVLDIDSPEVDPFSDEELELLEAVAQAAAPLV